MNREEIIADLQFQHKSVSKEKTEVDTEIQNLIKKIANMQILLTQLQYRSKILKEKKLLLKSEIHIHNRPTFSQP